MTTLKKHIFLLLLSFATLTAKAQLYVRANAYTDAITVTFFPLHPTAWSENITAGYKVERVEIQNGQALPATRTALAAKLLPQSPVWFQQHKADEGGLMEAVGALLYDSTFQFKDKSLIDPDSMRWNYVVYEATTRPRVGLATGMMLPDILAKPGKNYRYTVTSLGANPLTTSVEIQHSAGLSSQSPAEVRLDFKFPENRSLSDMIPRLEKPVFPQVFALAKAYGDSIVVRWAPSSAELWSTSNEKGYYLLRNLQPNSDTSFTSLDTLGLIKPWPKEQTIRWAESDGSDSMAMLAAGLLYSDNSGIDMGPVSEQAQTFETKYGFALFAAEGSQLASKILGLGYADKNVLPGKTYNYRLVAVDAPSPYSQATVSVKNEKTALPSPVSFQAKPGDHLIELTWEIPENVRHFSAYQLERSENDGKTWRKLHDTPLVFANSEAASLDVYRFRDSVETNYQPFRYRLKGLDSFGEWSPWSELKSEAVDLTPPPVADVSLAAYNDTTNTALIQWSVPELPTDFKAFYIVVGDNESSPTDTIAVLKSDLREFRWKPDTLLTKSYFVWVFTMDTHGNAAPSIEKALTVPDLKAPPPPALVVGNIDEDGTVTLVWEHSTATDVKGYWVYIANDTTSEFTNVNQEILYENALSWKVEDVTLNKYLYVVIRAEDASYNKGKLSKVLALKRPDKVPPPTPVLVSAAQMGQSVVLKWKPATDGDTKQLHLLKRLSEEAASDWALLDTLTIFEKSFQDTGIYLGMQYQYALVAEDNAGNLSDTSNSLFVKIRFMPAVAAVKNLKVQQSAPEVAMVKLTWEYGENGQAGMPTDNYEFLVYRSAGNENLEFIAAVPSTQQDFEDLDVFNNVVYNYAVQSHFIASGEMGTRSPVVSVMTKGKNPLEPKRQVGEAVAELVLRGRGLAIQNGDDSPTVEDNTDFGRVGTGSVASHKFAIQNNGEQVLEIPDQPVSLEGGDRTQWAILQPIKTKVNGYGNTEEFTIEFRPKAEGEYVTKVKIGGEHPYEFTIKGVGVRQPELDVQGKGVTIQNKDNSPTPDDDSDFGAVATGVKATRIFSLKNLGIDPLRLNGEPKIEGDPAFSIGQFVMPKSSSLPPNDEIFLFVEFQPIQTGVHDATITILSDDTDENPYTFAIEGLGIGPEISLLSLGGNPIPDGSKQPSKGNDTDFGNAAVGSKSTQQFIIKNQGDRSLNLTGKPKVTISGPQAADFKALEELPIAVKPGGGELRFTVEFQPSGKGLRQAVINIENNDADEGDYQFSIQGTGL
ncbi:MAG: choice-of-anchor D domain-containing protein [Bacteroidetes bacterium]|nr:choice-of-anchor D domain-containing protein [Bacteroidota bacterium]